MNIKELISRLTLEEKATLLQGKTMWTTWEIPRLGIPSIFLSDGPHGLRKQAGPADNLGVNESVPATCFPTAAAMANSWDTALGEELGRYLGEEAAANDVNVLLGPGLNIKRSPLCGRNFEYFSEDPYLAGKMAAAYIRGIQSKGVAACPKHFAANSQELRRMSTDSVVDERTLREIYLTNFEIAVTEGNPKTIMSSYNRVNGTYANENGELLLNTLRGKWGFDGFVMSDWGASNDHVAGVKNGSALEMPAPGLDSAMSLVEAVKAGKLDEADVDARVEELLKIVEATYEPVANASKQIDRAAFQQMARRCAAESVVLLENDGILPLKSGSRVAVIGEFAEQPRYQGAGSSLVNPTQMDNLLEHLKGKGLYLTGYAKGYTRKNPNPELELIQEAVQLCAGADTVLLCMGLDENSEIEGQDRENLKLPESQTALLHALARVNSNIVLVLSGGAPFLMPERSTYRAAIHGYLAGQAGGAAMADALVGIVNPSGKLSETWPLALEDTPCFRYYPGKMRTCEYREGLYVGYRYYDTANIPARYPFGYGLSYTTFAYSDLKIDTKQVTFTLTNTGRADGAEVAQVYISCKNGKIFRPKKELKGFAKVFLKAGESKQVTVLLDDKAFRYFDIHTGNFEVETGEYEISVAASVSDVKLIGTIPRLIGSAEPAAENLPNYACGNVTDICDAEFAALLGRPIPDGRWTEEIDINDPLSRLGEAKGALARFGFKMLKKKMDSDPSDSMMLYVFHLPLRAVAKTTAGAITENMAKDIQNLANGHAVAGLCRLIGHYFSDKKKMKAFQAKLEK